MKALSPAPEYTAFLRDVKGRIQSARLNAGRAVNRELVGLYWDLGRAIVEKQEIEGWGESVVERLASDLQSEFPDMRGFSTNNLWAMRRFFVEYGRSPILQQLAEEFAQKEGPTSKASRKESSAKLMTLEQLVQEIPWGHHMMMLDKVKDPAARLYYLRATAQCGWSRSILLNQIKAGTYERAVKEKKTHNFELALPEQADEMLKSRYNLEFLGLAKPMKERELEDRLTERLQQFIRSNPIGVAEYQTQPRLPAEFKGKLPTAKQLAEVVREIMPAGPARRKGA